MAHAVNDRVKETTTTTGTGTITLAGASTGFQSFDAGIGNGNTTYYCISDGTNWEVGRGTVTIGGTNTLSRTTIYQSSNADAAVNFGVGTKSVFCCMPSQHIGDIMGDGTVGAPGMAFLADQDTGFYRTGANAIALAVGGVLLAAFSSALIALTGAFTATTTIKAGTGIAVGGATPGAGGVAFPAVAVAVADANTLDEYQEAVWTPVLAGSGTAGSPTYAVQSGGYTKIGDTVHYWGRIAISAWGGSPTGNAVINGLPETIGSYAAAAAIASIDQLTHAANYTQFTLNLAAGGTQIAIREIGQAGGANNAAAVPVAAVSVTSFDMSFSGSYKV